MTIDNLQQVPVLTALRLFSDGQQVYAALGRTTRPIKAEYDIVRARDMGMRLMIEREKMRFIGAPTRQ